MNARAVQHYAEEERMKKNMYEISSELPDTSSRTVHLPDTVGGEGYDDGGNSIYCPPLTDRLRFSLRSHRTHGHENKKSSG